MKEVDILDEALDYITKIMLKSRYEEVKSKKEEVITMRKVDFYNFCIKLVKLLKNVEEMEQ